MHAGGHVYRQAAVAEKLLPPWRRLVNQHLQTLHGLGVSPKSCNSCGREQFCSADLTTARSYASIAAVRGHSGDQPCDLTSAAFPAPERSRRQHDSYAQVCGRSELLPPRHPSSPWHGRISRLSVLKPSDQTRGLHSHTANAGITSTESQTDVLRHTLDEREQEHTIDTPSGETLEARQTGRQHSSELRGLRNTRIDDAKSRQVPFTVRRVAAGENGNRSKRRKVALSTGWPQHHAVSLLKALKYQRSRASGVNVGWEDIFTAIRQSSGSVHGTQAVISIRGRAEDLRELDHFDNFQGLSISHVKFGSLSCSFIYGPSHAVQEAKVFLEKWRALQVFSNYSAMDAPAASKSTSMPRSESEESEGDMDQKFASESKAFQRGSSNAIPDPATYVNMRNFLDSNSVEELTAQMRPVIDEDMGAYYVLDRRQIHAAMRLFFKHSKLSLARFLLFKMESLGFPPTVETYNICLGHCASEMNLAAWSLVHDMMLQRGIAPNADTWLTVLQLAPNIDTRQRCIRELHRRGYTADPKVNLKLVPLIIQQSFPQHIEAGGDLNGFKDALTELYGPTWLTQQAVYAMLEVLGSYELYDTALDLLQSLSKIYDFRPSMSHMNVLLVRLADQLNLSRALSILEHFNREYKLTANLVTNRRLFRLAWECKSPNVLKVIWNFSLLHNQQTSLMRAKILVSLRTALDGQPSDSSSVSSRWRAQAGAIAIGRLPEFASPLAPMTESALRDGESEVRAGELFTEERSRTGRQLPVRPYVDMLLEAFELDREWAVSDYCRTKSLRWLVGNAVTVPLRFVWKARNDQENADGIKTRHLDLGSGGKNANQHDDSDSDSSLPP